MAPLSTQRLAATSIAVFVIFIFIFSSAHSGAAVQTFKHTAQSAAAAAKSYYSTTSPSFQDSISSLYKAIRHPLTAESYVDAYGKVFEVTEEPTWSTSLGRDVLILDIDTRQPNGTNDIFNPAKINWETQDAHKGSGMLSVAFANHFLYSQIHGYDYKYLNARPIEGLHNTWVKPHALEEMLHSYRFVIFIDADATIEHLEVPVEWLFNRWNITPHTSIAMPLDTKQIIGGNENTSCDSRGNLELNSGVIIAQNLPHTFDMLDAWKTCTNEERYPGCGKWKEEWSHEQRAFSEYIRYDFNPDGNNIVEIPCDDAMGYPGLVDMPNLVSDCHGYFMRHHTIDKGRTKTSSDNAMLQSLGEIIQKTLLAKQKEIWIQEGEPEAESIDD